MTTQNLVKWYPPISDEPTPSETALHTRLLFNASNDHDQAITLLKSQLEKQANQTVTQTVIQTVITVLSTQFPGMGNVNNQSSQTAYTVQSSDNGVQLILSDASPIAITLNSAIQTPFFLFINNIGAGTATLTPSSGQVNGGATFSLTTNNLAVVSFDGINWWAGV